MMPGEMGLKHVFRLAIAIQDRQDQQTVDNVNRGPVGIGKTAVRTGSHALRGLQQIGLRMRHGARPPGQVRRAVSECQGSVFVHSGFRKVHGGNRDVWDGPNGHQQGG